MTSEVVGPVESIAPGRMVGARPARPDRRPSGDWKPGLRVAVSGLRRPDGVIVASLIEPRGSGPDRVAGPVRRERGRPQHRRPAPERRRGAADRQARPGDRHGGGRAPDGDQRRSGGPAVPAGPEAGLHRGLYRPRRRGAGGRLRLRRGGPSGRDGAAGRERAGRADRGGRAGRRSHGGASADREPHRARAAAAGRAAVRAGARPPGPAQPARRVARTLRRGARRTAGGPSRGAGTGDRYPARRRRPARSGRQGRIRRAAGRRTRRPGRPAPRTRGLRGTGRSPRRLWRWSRGRPGGLRRSGGSAGPAAAGAEAFSI